jgi:hypothetical protein
MSSVESTYHSIRFIHHLLHIEVVHLSLLNAWLMTSPLGTPRGRCDEYSSKIFPQLRNQGMSILERRDKRLKVMQTGLIAHQQGRHLRHLLTRLRPVATWNLHTTQPITLFPTCDKVVNLTGLLETKGMSVSSGKQ